MHEKWRITEFFRINLNFIPAVFPHSDTITAAPPKGTMYNPISR